MRVGILTFPNSPSFGATLQMHALYRALQNLGCEVEIVNYRNTFMSKKKHIRKTGRMKDYINSVFDIPRKIRFRDFERQLSFFPKRILGEKDDLKQIADRYDYLICGSDQVWNPKVTGEDLNYFFSFCEEDAKKISYAASFGVNELSGDYALRVKEQLEKFHCISVREEQGVRIVSSLLHEECALVLDPTMLISSDEWRSCEQKPAGLPSRYIAKFIFNYRGDVEDEIRTLEKQTGLPVLTVGGTLLSKLKGGNFTGSIGPREWLYILDHADYVVTDSFHGAAFSILFHKNLLVSLASATNSRLKTLLHTFDLDNRIIGGVSVNDRIDYEHVQAIMNKNKVHSLDFLKKALNIGG